MQTIKYDPDAWVHLKANNEAPIPSEAHIRLSKPGTVLLDFGDGFKPVGYGVEFKLVLTRPATVKADQSFSVFISIDNTVQQLGQPLTNFDKRPGMSSVERMIKTQFRERELKQRLAREARAKADHDANQKRVEDGLQDENPVPDPTPPPPPTPEPEPSPEPASTEPET